MNPELLNTKQLVHWNGKKLTPIYDSLHEDAILADILRISYSFAQKKEEGFLPSSFFLVERLCRISWNIKKGDIVMSKKIIPFLLCNIYLVQAAEPAPKKRVNTVAELGLAIRQVKEARATSRPLTPDMSRHRAGPRIEGDPEQRKNVQEKK